MSPKQLIITAIGLGLVGCYSLPDRTLPRDVSESMPSQFTSVTPLAQGDVEEEWWRAFGDPALDEFVAGGLTHNGNLAIGAARLLEALAISSGAGSAARHSIGTGVIGGMLASTLIAVIFIPTFFTWVARRRQMRAPKAIEEAAG